MGLMDLVAKVRIDGGGIQQGLNQAQNSIKKFGSDIRGMIVGAFGGAALVSAVRRTLQEIEQIQSTSNEFDMPVESVQAMNNAMKEVGKNTQSWLEILRQIQKVQLDIVNGSPAGQKAMNVLSKHGYSRDDIAGMTEIGFAKVLRSLPANELKQIQESLPKLLGFKDAIDKLDEVYARDIKNGRIKTQQELDEIQQTVAVGRAAWDGFWEEIFYGLSSIVVSLKEIIDWLDNINPAKKGISKMEDGRLKSFLSELATPSLGTISGLGAPAKLTRLFKTLFGDIAPKEGVDINKRIDPLTGTPFDGKGKGIYTDSLLSVGNFLGQNMDNMTTAISLMELNKRTADNTKKAADELVKLNNKINLYPATMFNPSDFIL